MKIVKADRRGITEALKVIKSGGSVVYPTDTSYGLAADATNPSAVKRLYKIKQRGYHQPVHVIVASLAQAKRIAKFNLPAQRLFKKFFPGPLTVVLKLDPRIKNLKSWKILSGGTGTVGIRMPKDKIALELVKKLGRPITATSANPPNSLGGYDCYNVEDVIKQFKLKKHSPDFILDAGRLPKVKPSTIVSLSGERVTIIRTGPVSKKTVLAALKN